MDFYVSVPTVAAICFALLMGILIPVSLFVFFKKKAGGTAKAYFTGCGVFLVFAIILEKSIQSILFLSPIGSKIMNNTLLFSAIGGLFAGVFEEMGRFTAFKTILKKDMDDNRTALMYGAGHGGFEVLFLIFSAMITNLVFAIAINSGNVDKLTQGLDEKKLAATLTLIQQLSSTKPSVFLISIAERISAVALHICFSVFVWFGVKNKKWYLIVLAILLHALVDCLAGLLSMIGLPIWAIELGLYVYAGLMVVVTNFIWKKNGISGNI